MPKPRLTWLHELKRYKNQVCSFVSLNAELQNGIRSEDLTAKTPEASQAAADSAPRARWHFIDEPFSTDDTPLQQPVPPNAETQIAVFRKTLADKTISDDIRSYDLAWLLHLVGDVHQPLHATAQARIAALHSMLV